MMKPVLRLKNQKHATTPAEQELFSKGEGRTEGKARMHGVLLSVMKGLLMQIKESFALENESP